MHMEKKYAQTMKFISTPGLITPKVTTYQIFSTLFLVIFSVYVDYNHT